MYTIKSCGNAHPACKQCKPDFRAGQLSSESRAIGVVKRQRAGVYVRMGKIGGAAARSHERRSLAAIVMRERRANMSLEQCQAAQLAQASKRKGSASRYWLSGPAIREWRMRVLARDNFRCTKCASTNQLEADHIQPLSSHPELAYVLANGRTLCRKCHEETDTHWRKSWGRKRWQFQIPLAVVA